MLSILQHLVIGPNEFQKLFFVVGPNEFQNYLNFKKSKLRYKKKTQYIIMWYIGKTSRGEFIGMTVLKPKGSIVRKYGSLV